MRGTALQAAKIFKENSTDSNTGIVILDTSGLINYANDIFCTLSGYKKEELIGKDDTIFNSDHQSDTYLESLYKALNKGNIWNDKLQNNTKNGVFYCVDRTIIPFLDIEGKPEMYVSIYVDITNETELIDSFANNSYAIDQHSIIAKTDNKGFITYVNDNFCLISGYSKEELVGQNHRVLNSENKPKSYWKEMYAAISKGNIWQDEVKNKNKHGSFYWVNTTIVPRLGEDGKPESYISIRSDITKQKELSNAFVKHKFAIDQHAIIATTDVTGKITYANDKFVEISGYSKEELIGQNHRILNSGNQPASYWKAMYQTVLSGNIWKDQVKNISKNGSYYWVDTSIIPFLNDNGKANSFFSIRTDITYQKKIEEILANQRFAMDQHSIIAMTDIKGNITYANDKFCKISAYTEKELIGKNHRILNSGNQPSSYWKKMFSVLENKGVWQDAVKNKNKYGEYYWVDTTIIPFLDSNGNIDCYISIRTDITKYKKVEEELKEHQDNLEQIVKERTKELDEANKQLTYLSEVDTLTKLSNRRKLEIDFVRELKKCNRFNRKMALFFLDLDKFKYVNDTYGHEIGDLLLKSVSSSILEVLRNNEYVYRIGGDEFCILIPEFTEQQELEGLAKRLLETISNINSIKNCTIDIGCSIGISIFPDNGNTLNELIVNADKAMYIIKHQGKNNYHFISS